jgi:hypothetical protein
VSTFNEDLRKAIDKWARNNPSNHSCEVVQNGVIKEMGFDIMPLLEFTWPALSGIQKKINALNQDNPGYVKKVDAQEAAHLATQNGGGYIVLALINYEYATNKWKSHAAIVLDGEYNDIDGPKMGGGGMDQMNIDKGWILSNARIHFTYLDKVNYYFYGYKKD